MRRLPALVAVALVLLAVALVPAAYTDRASCQRATVDVGVKHTLDLQAAQAAHAAARQLDPLDCALPLPETR